MLKQHKPTCGYGFESRAQLCLFWPEDADATFYIQASSTPERDAWLDALRSASTVSSSSLRALGMAELKQRVVACGLVGPSDYTHERSQLEAKFVEHVSRARRADYHNMPASVVATTSEATTGLARTVLASPHAKPSLFGAALGMVRGAVSLNKTRYQADGFDLDLTYITPRLIAMAYPSAGLEGYYRNDVEQVGRFFGTYHPARRWRVFNLCEERVYDGAALGGEHHPDCVHHWPFDDHNPPAFDMIHPLCLTVREWLERHPDNVAAVHCKAGKGRTGLVVSCILIHLGIAQSADEAICAFGAKRTHDGKGVTIPSQKRYVRYYAQRYGTEGAPSSDDIPSRAVDGADAALPASIPPTPPPTAPQRLPMPPQSHRAAPAGTSAGDAAGDAAGAAAGDAADGAAGGVAGGLSTDGRSSCAGQAGSRASCVGGAGVDRLSLAVGCTGGRASYACRASYAGVLSSAQSGCEAGLWPCRLLRSLGRRWQATEQPLLRVTSLSLRGCPSSKYDGAGCQPYVVVRHSVLVAREAFGDAEMANGHILPCTCVTQRQRKIFDSRRHTEAEHVHVGGGATLVSGGETPALLIKGDTKFALYSKPMKGLKTELGHFWVHSAFLAASCGAHGGGELTLRRDDLDKACKKKYADRYPAHFELTLRFERHAPHAASRDDPFAHALEHHDDESDAEADDDDDDDDEEHDLPATETSARGNSTLSSALRVGSMRLKGLLKTKRQDVSTAF